MPAPVRYVAIALAVMLGAFGALIGGYALVPGPGAGKMIELEWPAGLGSGAAVDQLASAGLVRSPGLFRLYLLLSGGASSIRPGLHLLEDDMSPRTLLRRLRRIPGGSWVRVTIPEGFNKFDIAARLRDNGVCSTRSFISATTDPTLLEELRLGVPDVEGYLFPATYTLSRDAEAADVVRKMVLEADRRYARVFDTHESALAELKASVGFDKPQVLTLASIIEKEAAVDEERPLIASVFLNRLRDVNTPVDKRKLQSDPTARYGCLLAPGTMPSCGPDNKITAAMIHDPANPYSTYTNAGLTPGPICNPSDKSVLAVLAPAKTNYFFFVAKGGGRHTFSETLDEHNSAVKARH